MQKWRLTVVASVAALLIGGGSYMVAAAKVHSTQQNGITSSQHVQAVPTTPREYGMIPAQITWQGQTYRIIGGLATEIGPKLGTASCGHNCTREVYQVKGFDPKREVAIQQQKDAYFKAVNLTVEEMQTLIKQNLLKEMSNYIQLKQSDTLSSSDDVYYKRLFREERLRISDGDRAKYVVVVELIRQGKLDAAKQQVEQLKKSLPELKF